jgi:hypothetical protein
MTKKVLVINADGSNHKVKVEVFDHFPSQQALNQEPLKVDEKILYNPGDFAEVFIHSHRHFTVSEVKE